MKKIADIPTMPPLEAFDKVKKGKALKLWIPSKPTKHSVLLAQVKAGNYLYKLKNEIKEIV